MEVIDQIQSLPDLERCFCLRSNILWLLNAERLHVLIGASSGLWQCPVQRVGCRPPRAEERSPAGAVRPDGAFLQAAGLQ